MLQGLFQGLLVTFTITEHLLSVQETKVKKKHFFHLKNLQSVGKVDMNSVNRNISKKCPLMDEWTKKMWYICTVEYYSALRKNKIMPFAATCMDLEIIIQSEVSQTEKDKYHMISLICGI